MEPDESNFSSNGLKKSTIFFQNFSFLHNSVQLINPSL